MTKDEVETPHPFTAEAQRTTGGLPGLATGRPLCMPRAITDHPLIGQRVALPMGTATIVPPVLTHPTCGVTLDLQFDAPTPDFLVRPTSPGYRSVHTETPGTLHRLTGRELRYLAVRTALSDGKPVPPEVLADYPDLAQNPGDTHHAPAD
jgi:hypothetical protein